MSSIEEDVRFAALRAQLARSVDRICPRWLSAQRDDIVQVAITRLVQICGRSERKEPYPASYLWKVAYSALIDEIRRLRRNPAIPLDDADATELPMSSVAADPERLHLAAEIGEAIEACLGRLGEDRRLALTLHLMGHSSAETAATLGWNVKRAENLIYRGLADLRTCLRSKGLEPSSRDE